MKRVIFFLAASVVALLAGVAVFLWSGESPSDLVERGRELESRIDEVGQMGRKKVEQAREIIRQTPIPSLQTKSPDKKPEEPEINEENPSARAESPSTPRPQPPTAPATPPGPPMENISTKDREKLERLLGD